MLILLIIVLLTSIMPLSSLADTAKIYYVSNSGNDLNDGMSLNAPFEHIQKAANVMKYGDTCYIRGGTYRETVTPKYSGAVGSKIKYANYNGEVVTVKGTDLLTNWSLDSGNVYKALRSMTFGAGNQIFVDGVLMEAARWPNNTGTLFAPTLAVADEGTSTTITDGDLTQSDNYWKDAQVWCLGFLEWSAQRKTITSSSQANNKITFGAFSYAPQKDNKYYLTGLKSLLDTEKEWWYDKNSGYVYLWKPGGGSPATNTVETRQRACGFNLSDRSYIDITGINFFATGLYTNINTGNCIFDNITARYTMNGDVDDGGIRLYGNNLELKNSTVEYSSKYLVSVNGTSNKVVNCLLRYGDYEARPDSLIELNGSNHLISHNTVGEAGRSCIGGKAFSNCQIQYNEMYNVGRLTKDLGVTYIGNVDAGNTRIHHNIFHDNFDTAHGGGIYLDNYSENFVIDHNVVWGCKDAMRLNTPNDSILVYNNTLISSVNSFDYWGGNFARVSYANRVYNNIFSNATNFPPDIVLDNNIYSNINPLYVDAIANNYRLTSSSPAIDKGRILNGISDVYANTMPDVGAYEYNGEDWTAGHNFTNPPNPTFNGTVAPYINMLKNAGFEMNNLSNWSTFGSGRAMVVYNDAWNDTYHTGNSHANWYGLSLGGTAATDGVFQTITGLSPNTTYVVSAWLKATSGEIVEIGAKNFGGTKKGSQTTSTKWEQKTCEFTTGNSNTTADIYILKNTVTAGYCYADVLSVVPLSSSQIGTGFVDTFSQPDGYVPTFDDGWNITGLVAGDSVTVQQGTLKLVKSGTTDGTMNVSRKNLNLDINAGGKITVEFETRFPDLLGTSYNKFPVVNGIKEDGSGEYGTINSSVSPYEIYTYYFADGANKYVKMLGGLNVNPSTWHKITYEIDTETDTFTGIADSVTKLSNGGVTTNSKIKSLDSISFTINKGTADSVYYIRNLKVIPHILPKVIDSTPINGQYFVETQNSIVLNFNTDMNTSTLTNSNITVSNGLTPNALTDLPTSEYSVVPIIDSITGKCRAISLNFSKNLNNLLEYKITVSGNVSSLYAIPLSSDNIITIPSQIQVTAFSLTGANTTNITASVSLRNYNDSQKTADFLIVAYDKTTEKLVSAKSISQTIASNVAATSIPLSLTLPSVGTNYIVKGYLWDSFSTLKPLKTTIPFQQ
jgi:hypothetical protein